MHHQNRSSASSSHAISSLIFSPSAHELNILCRIYTRHRGVFVLTNGAQSPVPLSLRLRPRGRRLLIWSRSPHQRFPSVCASYKQTHLPALVHSFKVPNGTAPVQTSASTGETRARIGLLPPTQDSINRQAATHCCSCDPAYWHSTRSRGREPVIRRGWRRPRCDPRHPQQGPPDCARWPLLLSCKWR